MQLRKMLVMLSALGAMSLMMTACDGGETDTPGLCTDDTGCLETEICHPTAKTCVTKCTSGNDCTGNAKTCGPVTPGSSVQVCKCESTQLCNLDREAADLVCSDVDKVCMKACATDTDCPTGRTCDTATGQCKAGAATTCTPACAANETCDTSGATPVCKPTTGATCNPANQPGTCSYGQICGSANTCEAAAQGTCTQATATGAPVWNQAGKTAPVIVSVSGQSRTTSNPTTECSGGGANALITVRYYAPGGLTTHSSSYADMQNHVKYRVGNDFFGPAFVTQHPTAGAAEGTLTFGTCNPASRQAAVYLANEAGQTSNVVCVTW